MPKRNENIGAHENWHTNVHRALFTIAKRCKQPNIHQLVNGEINVVFLCNGVLFTHKKELGFATHYNMDEPGKGHIVSDSIYMRYPEQANPQRQKVD